MAAARRAVAAIQTRAPPRLGMTTPYHAVFSIGKTSLFLYNSTYMNKRRPRSDDVLFISALSALLLGVALLLYTTGTFGGTGRPWPFLIMAAGGFLLYLALVREFSFSILFVGIIFVLEGALVLVSILLEWKLIKAWPLGMALVGFAGVISSLIAKRKMRASFSVPSIGFVFLGLTFSAFSFGFMGVSFKSFIVIWWPTLLIAGGISLFVAYGLSRKRSPKRSDASKAGGKKGAGSPPAGRSGRGRGPTSST